MAANVPVLDVQAGGPDQLKLTLSNGSQKIQPAGELKSIDPKASFSPDNYRRRGFHWAISHMNYWLLAVAVIITPLQLFGMAYRWWRLLVVQGIKISYWETVRLTWLGSFFNYIILGTTGGDLVKAYYASRHTEHKTECLVTVFIDRVVGFFGLTLLSAVMLLIVFSCKALGVGRCFDAVNLKDLHSTALWIGIFLGGLLVCGAVGLSGRLRRLLHISAIYDRLPLRGQISRVGQSLQLFRHHIGAVVKASEQTVILQLMFIVSIIFMGASLHMGIPFYQYLIYIPLIYIIAAIPIVPGGVGLAETVYITSFVAFAGQSEILALALLARLIPMFSALPGVLVAITGPKIPPAEQIQAEMAAAQAREMAATTGSPEPTAAENCKTAL